MSQTPRLPHDPLDLTELPPLADVFDRMGPAAVSELKPLLARLPLIELLNRLMADAERAGNARQQRAFLDLARLAVAKHDYTRQLHAQLAAAVSTTSLSEAAALLAGLPPRDTRLAMEMLSLISELLALEGLHDKGVYAFGIARLIAEQFGLEANKAVVLHQLGMYELRRERLVEAEAALKDAADIFSRVAPNMERETNRLRAIIYKLRLQREASAPEPEDLDTIAAGDPQSAEIIALARANRALDKDNLAAAESFLRGLRAGRPRESSSTETLLVEARLARRKGLFEEADLLIKQAAQRPDAAKHADAINRQAFYLSRDLGHEEQSQRLLERLKESSDPIHLDYQRALVSWRQGDRATAEKLFRQCLSQADNDSFRADCMGMLALVVKDVSEVLRFMYDAIGLYHRLGRKLDHAISLSHLAAAEIAHGTLWKESGRPMVMQYQFTRADNLLRHAQDMAEELGAGSFLLDLTVNRAKLELERERYNVALRHFERAATVLELNYLSMTDRRSADLYAGERTAFYALAIRCALSAGRPDIALLFSERSKARRFLRDAAEIAGAASAQGTDALAGEEATLLATVRPLRSRLLQHRPLSPQEQQALYDAQHRLNELWRRVKESPATEGGLAVHVQQPVEAGVLRRIIFGPQGSAEDDARAPSEVEEEIQELPGGNVMQCGVCFVYNRITSTFCSACETRLPKSASVNMNLALGTASEEEWKEAYSDSLYNEGMRLFSDEKFEEAEQFFRKALEQRPHPDFSFFLGLCRLFAGDPADALANFDEVLAQQYAAKYAFWPLPLNPSVFRSCVEPLRGDRTKVEGTLVCLLTAYSDFAEGGRPS